MANPFVHIELNTPNIPASKAFYTGLLDWQLEDHQMSDGVYTSIRVGEGTGGGMWDNTATGAPPHWLAYVEVDDIVAKTAKAKELGATILQDVKNIGDFGALSIIKDPVGAIFALWQNSNVEGLSETV